MINGFTTKLKEVDESFLKFEKLETLQINLGNKCNQSCRHCHVDAGPTLSEISKRASGSYYSEKLFSEKTKKILKFLFHYRGSACAAQELKGKK